MASESKYEFKFLWSPSNRTQTSGKVLEPHLIIEVTGDIPETEFMAVALDTENTQLAGEVLATGFGWTEAEIEKAEEAGKELPEVKETGPNGKVLLRFDNLRIVNPGTHQIPISISVLDMLGINWDEIGQLYTEPIQVRNS